MELRREATCGRAGVRGIAVAMLATVVCGTPAAGQWLLFEPPLYRGSAEGVPLAGQDGWYVPGVGIESEWRVYHNGSSELGLDPLPGGDAQVAGVALEAPIAGPELIEHSIAAWPEGMIIIVDLAVDFDQSLPAGEEIGRMTLEPEGESRSFGWVARRDDGGAETWTFDLIYYSAEGERRQEAVFEGLAPGAWHQLRVYLGLQIDIIEIVDARTLRERGISPQGYYLAGGAAGGLGLPRALRLSAGAGDSVGAALVLGFDNLWTHELEPCYGDCNKDGEWDFFDFLCFQTRFAERAVYADCDGSGALDFFDFLCFRDAFVSRCGGP